MTKGQRTFSCPVCHGEPSLLGRLGKLVWYRCRDCGTEFSQREALGTRARRSRKASREEQHGRYIDSGPAAWDDQ